MKEKEYEERPMARRRESGRGTAYLRRLFDEMADGEERVHVFATVPQATVFKSLAYRAGLTLPGRFTARTSDRGLVVTLTKVAEK